MRLLKVFGPAVAIGALLVTFAQLAAASCRPPVSVAENAAQADAVVQGRIVAVDRRELTVAVVAILKGNVASTITVFIGPNRGSVVTSVDYAAKSGEEHVLYVKKVADGYETNACVGSHSGTTNAEERAFFGTTNTPSVAPSPTAPPAALPAPSPNTAETIAVALAAFGVLLLSTTWILALRRARQT